MKKRLSVIIALLLSLSLLLSGCTFPTTSFGESDNTPKNEESSVTTLENIPEFDGKTPYVEINGNMPFFTEESITSDSFESYSELDSLGRCGVATASVGIDIMPTEERTSISGVKPSGWQTVKYDIISTKYLYNRCHLIGYQLTGENANVKNLITGTRYLNVDGMLPFENMVADYVKETENHVMYRVSPIFVGSELVARGVLMEALSVEDSGEDICFCVYVYNNQPGITIDYKTGKSYLSSVSGGVAGDASDEGATDSSTDTGEENLPEEIEGTFILNSSSKAIHRESCKSVSLMAEKNKILYTGLYSALVMNGYSPCKNCNPSEIYSD